MSGKSAVRVGRPLSCRDATHMHVSRPGSCPTWTEHEEKTATVGPSCAVSNCQTASEVPARRGRGTLFIWVESELYWLWVTIPSSRALYLVSIIQVQGRLRGDGSTGWEAQIRELPESLKTGLPGCVPLPEDRASRLFLLPDCVRCVVSGGTFESSKESPSRVRSHQAAAARGAFTG